MAQDARSQLLWGREEGGEGGEEKGEGGWGEGSRSFILEGLGYHLPHDIAIFFFSLPFPLLRLFVSRRRSWEQGELPVPSLRCDATLAARVTAHRPPPSNRNIRTRIDQSFISFSYFFLFLFL